MLFPLGLVLYGSWFWYGAKLNCLFPHVLHSPNACMRMTQFTCKQWIWSVADDYYLPIWKKSIHIWHIRFSLEKEFYYLGILYNSTICWLMYLDSIYWPCNKLLSIKFLLAALYQEIHIYYSTHGCTTCREPRQDKKKW